LRAAALLISDVRTIQYTGNNMAAANNSSAKNTIQL
jgi:hypothetical protein